MPKRKNSRAASGSGSIRQRPDGVWEARFSIGYNPASGKLIRKSVYGKTQAIVRQKMNAAIADIDKGTYSEPSNMTLKQWLEIWLETYTSHLAPRTLSQYTGYINGRIIPALGKVKLSRLDVVIVQRFYNDLAKEVAPKTVSNIHGILHKSLEQAQAVGYIARNPLIGAKLPKIEKKQIQAFSEPEMIAFLEAARGTELELLFKFALFTGMRMGEITGLTWDRVDFERGSITIDRQLQRINKEMVLIPPKHNKLRTIFPAHSVIQLLEQQKRLQAVWEAQSMGVWQDSGFVFTNIIGRYLLSGHVYKEFKRVCTRSGRPDARFHDLRHTYAVNSLKAGDDPKTLSENLGHHSVAFTLDVYAFALDEMKKASGDKMESFLQSILPE